MSGFTGHQDRILKRAFGKLVTRLDTIERRIAELEAGSGTKSQTTRRAVLRDVSTFRTMQSNLAQQLSADEEAEANDLAGL